MDQVSVIQGCHLDSKYISTLFKTLLCPKLGQALRSFGPGLGKSAHHRSFRVTRLALIRTLGCNQRLQAVVWIGNL